MDSLEYRFHNGKDPSAFQVRHGKVSYEEVGSRLVAVTPAFVFFQQGTPPPSVDERTNIETLARARVNRRPWDVSVC